MSDDALARKLRELRTSATACPAYIRREIAECSELANDLVGGAGYWHRKYHDLAAKVAPVEGHGPYQGSELEQAATDVVVSHALGDFGNIVMPNAIKALERLRAAVPVSNRAAPHRTETEEK